MIERAADGVRLLVAPEDGGRVAQLDVRRHRPAGRPAAPASHPMLWGSFPMVPWAGRVAPRALRVRRAHLRPAARPAAPRHPRHGLPPARGSVEPDGSLADRARPSLALRRHGPPALRPATPIDLDLHASRSAPTHRAMPAQAGWHPWFRRPVRLLVHGQRDATSSTTRASRPARLVPVPPGPWDDCFTNLLGPPQLAWPDGPTVTITSSCTDWVVYDRPEHALCVEPQTGPPDALQPGAPGRRTGRTRWWRR